MNLIFEVNYASFAVFAALLITEIMGSVLMLLFWKQTKTKVLQYIVPIWEVTGTFGAFWVVTSDFAYPSLLVPVANMFAPLLVIFLILFVARNSTIVFAEFITKRKWLDEEKLYKVYSLSTVLLGVVVLIILYSLISGAGVDLTTTSFSLGNWLLAHGSLLFVIGTLLIGVGVAPVFYSLEPLRRIVLPVTIAGVLVSILSFFVSSSSLLSTWLVLPVALTLTVGVLFFVKPATKIVSNKAVFLLVLSIIIFSLQFLIYPSVIGQALSVDSVTTSGPMASAYVTITIVGSVLLALMLGFYILVAMRQKSLELNHMMQPSH